MALSVSCCVVKEQSQRVRRRAIDGDPLTRTISSRTSPGANESPSLTFHEAIPPSVIVGDLHAREVQDQHGSGIVYSTRVGEGTSTHMAGKRNLVRAADAGDAWKSAVDVCMAYSVMQARFRCRERSRLRDRWVETRRIRCQLSGHLSSLGRAKLSDRYVRRTAWVRARARARWAMRERIVGSKGVAWETRVGGRRTRPRTRLQARARAIGRLGLARWCLCCGNSLPTHAGRAAGAERARQLHRPSREPTREKIRSPPCAPPAPAALCRSRHTHYGSLHACLRHTALAVVCRIALSMSARVVLTRPHRSLSWSLNAQTRHGCTPSK